MSVYDRALMLLCTRDMCEIQRLMVAAMTRLCVDLERRHGDGVTDLELDAIASRVVGRVRRLAHKLVSAP